LAKQEKSETLTKKPRKIRGPAQGQRPNRGSLRLNYTYYSSAKDFFMDCSLRVVMT
jgi:hypothetical protein